MPPGGAIYAALLIIQAWTASALLIVVAALRIRRLRQDREGSRGVLLWLSFAFAVLALSFDWLAMAAGHSGNQTRVDQWRGAMLAMGFAAVLSTLPDLYLHPSIQSLQFPGHSASSSKVRYIGHIPLTPGQYPLPRSRTSGYHRCRARWGI